MAGDEINCLYLYHAEDKILLAKNKKAHSQGICELTWMKDKAYRFIFSGSFDGTIAQIDINNFTEVVRKFDLKIEGSTIWRIILSEKN